MKCNAQVICAFAVAIICTVKSQQCPENEYYDKCGSNCPPTCEYPNENCDPKCRAGCFCKPGLVRDVEIKQCVPLEECPGVEPGPCQDSNEVFKTCGPMCLQTCSDPKKNCSGCKKGCFCRDGYVRDDYLNYKCVPYDFCP